MGGGAAAIPKSGKFRVFVLMGQSNMHGMARAKELKSPYNEKHDRIRIWANGRWEYFVPRNRSLRLKSSTKQESTRPARSLAVRQVGGATIRWSRSLRDRFISRNSVKRFRVYANPDPLDFESVRHQPVQGDIGANS
jgi:hypothetical protein